MPQLKSGRHVSLNLGSYLDALKSGPDASRYFAIIALRLNASTPKALRDHLIVDYFVEGEGEPPHAPSYNSGYCLADVLEGRSDWTCDEVEEITTFVNEDLRFGTWLQTKFDELNHHIRDNAVWESDLLVNDLTSNSVDVSMMKRVIIQKSASERDAMKQLRMQFRNTTSFRV